LIQLMHGDCLEQLKMLPNEYFNCCVTSPPYYGLRDYGVNGQIGLEETPEEYVNKLVDVFREVRRVLREDGSLWLNIGDSYAANRSYQVPSTKGGLKHSDSQSAGGKSSTIPKGLKQKDMIGIPWRLAFALQADGWYLRQDIIWHKPNVMPESVKDRCTKSHEYVFMLTKSPKYYYNHNAVKEPAVSNHPSGNGFKRDSRLSYKDENGARGNEEQWQPTELRNRRSVWSINTKPFKEAHFAVFPEALVEPCLLAGCPENGHVLDPFNGSGTTGVVAIKQGKKYTGIELNEDYLVIARQRIYGAQQKKEQDSLENLFNEVFV